MSKWKEVKLAEICTELSDGLHKAPVFVDGGDYIFVNARNLCDGRIVDNDPTKKTTHEEYLKYSKPLNKNTILFSIDGTIGNIARYMGEKCVLGKGACYINPNPLLADSSYLYYQLQSPHFNSYLNCMSTGSTIKHISLKTMRNYEFLLPPIKNQRRIASILSSLDSKIECNRKICANLEAQAQALFKHWFVDFAPFKDGKFVESELGLIPEGWRVGTLGDVLSNVKEVIKPGDKPNLPYLPIDSIPMKSFVVSDVKDNSEAQSSLQLFHKNDIVVGAMRVYFHRVIPAPFDGITRNTCFVLRPKIDSYLSFALLSVNSNKAIEHAQKTSKGSTMPYAVWDGGLAEFQITIPPKGVAEDFNTIVQGLVNAIYNCSSENNRLATLRDTLLPKLMSGQIEL